MAFVLDNERLQARKTILSSYLYGTGVEIGPGPMPITPLCMPDTKLYFVDAVDKKCLLDGSPKRWHESFVEPNYLLEAHDMAVFEDAALDFVFSSHVFEHLDKPAAALREWARIIKPGGRIVMIVPSKINEKEWSKDGTTFSASQQQECRKKSEHRDHQNYFDSSALLNFILDSIVHDNLPLEIEQFKVLTFEHLITAFPEELFVVCRKKFPSVDWGPKIKSIVQVPSRVIEVINYLDVIVRKEPGRCFDRYRLAEMLYQVGLKKDARRMFETLINAPQIPQWVKANCRLNLLFLCDAPDQDISNSEAAQKEMDLAFESSNINGLYRMAWIFLRHGKPKMAEQLLKRLLQMTDAEDVQGVIYYVLGLCAARQGVLAVVKGHLDHWIRCADDAIRKLLGSIDAAAEVLDRLLNPRQGFVVCATAGEMIKLKSTLAHCGRSFNTVVVSEKSSDTSKKDTVILVLPEKQWRQKGRSSSKNKELNQSYHTIVLDHPAIRLISSFLQIQFYGV